MKRRMVSTMGHWSWIYFFNGECEDNGVNMWQWMSEQHR